MRHLLTGATSGIGREVALTLRDRGDELVLVVRDPERARDFPDAQLIVADLADPAQLEAVEVPERLDSVVHAAGVVELGPVSELSTQAWQDQLDINLVAPAVLTRKALPALRATGGTIVFVNSGAGLQAHAEWSAYAASKFGLRALADSLREEEAASGVRVTSIFPGRTATAMQEKVHAQEGKEYDEERWIRAETVAEAILRAIDLPRDATMPEIVIRPGR